MGREGARSGVVPHRPWAHLRIGQFDTALSRGLNEPHASTAQRRRQSLKCRRGLRKIYCKVRPRPSERGARPDLLCKNQVPLRIAVERPWLGHSSASKIGGVHFLAHFQAPRSSDIVQAMFPHSAREGLAGRFRWRTTPARAFGTAHARSFAVKCSDHSVPSGF